MMKNLCLVVPVALLIMALVGGCVAYAPAPEPYTVYAPVPPPQALVEVRPAVPYPDAVWIGGNWAYHGGNWAWRDGYWDRRPHRGADWEQGRWLHEGSRGWGYKPGHWR